MKSYFVKYLPIEGKIKEIKGTWVWAPWGLGQFELKIPNNGDGSTIHAYSQVHNGETYIKVLHSDLKPVGLFLCSEDIKVGDKIYATDPPDKDLILREWTEHLDLDIPNSISGLGVKGFKIIGEISQDALSYVDNNDEFDEEQIQQLVEIKMFEDDYYDEKDKKIDLDEVLKEELTHKSIERYEKLNFYKWKDAVDEIEVKIYYKTYKIKGPCGHFH